MPRKAVRNNRLTTRAAVPGSGNPVADLPRDITTRSLSLRLDAGGAPQSLDEKTRSVDVVAATENPVPVWDWERFEIVDEVLLMSGCELPESRQIPLLNTHFRGGVESVLGSCRQLSIDGTQLVGRAFYSEAPEAASAWQKTREGHLTDYSVGYTVTESYYVPEGEKQTIAGRTFEGPLKVSTRWKPKELSNCPIGADEMAKVRAAMPRPDKQPKESTMNEKLRKFLESRGLAKEATEEEAWSYLEKLDIKRAAAEPAVPPHGSPQQKTPDEIRDEAIRAEQDRIIEIRALCGQVGIADDKMTEFVRGGKSVEEVRKAALEHVLASTPKTPGFNPRIGMGADERDKFRSAAQDSLILRVGGKIDAPAPGASDLRGFSLRELARESLRMAGQPVGGDVLEMVGRALTTSDLPTILGNTANRSLMQGYETADETWRVWAGVGSVSDFKTNTLVRIGEMDDLDEIGEEGEFKYGSRTEGKEEYKIATYGKLFKISRQALINDDLGVLSDIPRAHGEAWARKIGDLVYAVLVANSAMGDGKALFHADHGNIGTTGLISETTMAEVIKLMKLQKDIGGKRRLNIRPQFILASAAQEGAAEIFFNSNQFTGGSGTSASTRTNPYAGNRFTRVYDARLDDADSDAWYAAGPKGKTVNVFFLGGNQSPYLETRQGWSVDGTEYKVRGDAGAKAVDWKALIYNAGA
jgi:phage major head subunit gpT-like protein